MIASGLNKLITIEKGRSETSNILSSNLVYDEYLTTYSNVYVRSGNVSYGDSEELSFTTEFTIRYNSLSKEINNKYRIKYNNQIYRIIEIIEVEPKHAIKIIGVHDYVE